MTRFTFLQKDGCFIKIFVGKHKKQEDEYVIGRLLSLVSSERKK
jgi:hypothetical protein